MPDYSNSMTRTAEAKLKPFEYPDECSTHNDLVEKSPCNIGEGIIYHGQWSTDNKRNGKGIQIWLGGQKYEGMWVNNKRHGKGRCIYPNGDVC